LVPDRSADTAIQPMQPKLTRPALQHLSCNPSILGGSIDNFELAHNADNNQKVVALSFGKRRSIHTLSPRGYYVTFQTIPTRPFGRTGHRSTVALFGAAALARASQDDADRALEVLLRYGVNHIDTAARYGDSELRIGPWMARHRNNFFLATKTGSRNAAQAREDIHRSLERLRVDQIDLIQLHSLSHPDDWDEAMGPGGALEAAVDARREGLVRFIGVTGHGWTIPAMHRRSLARFDFDSILMPYNFFMAQDPRYRENFEEVLAICRQRNVAVQIIKSIARGPWATADRTHTTWYQPLEAQADIDRAMHWILGFLPDVFVNTAGDLTLLPKILDSASRFQKRPSDAEMAQMLDASRMTSLFGLAT
jgi:aryl-alcohol dehydrogenase-like predicted oxidoreductase